ncbi:MAG: glycosyltransferase family 2 protein [Mariprofundaceae bacterium]|nr:glycosyltransferase family 2 protein [Mariprofundaceae bacterium]
MNQISVVMITKNAEKVLVQCLASLAKFDDVVLYDNGSSDQTLNIAAQFDNVVVFQGEFMGFGRTKAHAASLAKHDWIFSLDADEPMSPRLVEELLTMQLGEQTCYQVRRDNYFRGKHIKCCGWYPEYIVRLYHRNTTNFSDAKVHETVKIQGLSVKNLHHPIEHYSFFTVADFLTKIQSYSEIYADDMRGKKKVSVFVGVLRGLFAFIKSYFFRKGMFYGFEGFVIAFFHGLGTTMKYLKLYEKNH